MQSAVNNSTDSTDAVPDAAFSEQQVWLGKEISAHWAVAVYTAKHSRGQSFRCLPCKRNGAKKGSKVSGKSSLV